MSKWQILQNFTYQGIMYGPGEPPPQMSDDNYEHYFKVGILGKRNNGNLIRQTHWAHLSDMEVDRISRLASNDIVDYVKRRMLHPDSLERLYRAVLTKPRAKMLESFLTDRLKSAQARLGQ